MNKNLALYIAVLTVSVWLALGAVHTNFIVLDEYAHVPSGISYWQLGRFNLYRENPPLVQALVALPPLISGAEVDYSLAGPRRSEWAIGQAFVHNNVERLHDLFCRSRYVVLFLGAACGTLIYWWANKLFGGTTAVVCAALWLLDPNVLAFSSVVTTDIGSAAFCALAVYFFWRFLEQPSPGRMLFAGVGLGLAQATKFNMLILYPAWLMLAMVSRVRPWPDIQTIPAGRFALRFLSILLISLVVLNSMYLFDGSFKPLGSYQFRSQVFSGSPTVNTNEPILDNRFRYMLLSEVPVPFPRDYLLGLDSQKWDEEIGLANLGENGTVLGGTWYSPLRTLLFKLPLGTLLIITASAIYWLIYIGRRRFAEWTLWVPAIFLLGALCTQTGLNWPVRYSISILPLLSIAAGAIITPFLTHRLGKWIVLACLLWNLGATFQAAPHFLSYANAFVSGPTGGQRVFHGSNYDWGQDLIWLRRWYDQNQDMRPLTVSYFGVVSPGFVGIDEETLPASFYEGSHEPQSHTSEAPQTFYWAISSNLLHGVNDSFLLDNGMRVVGSIQSPFLRPENAVTRIGYTIYVFRIDSIESTSSEAPRIIYKDLESCLIKFLDNGLGLDAVP